MSNSHIREHAILCAPTYAKIHAENRFWNGLVPTERVSKQFRVDHEKNQFVSYAFWKRHVSHTTNERIKAKHEIKIFASNRRTEIYYFVSNAKLRRNHLDRSQKLLNISDIGAVSRDIHGMDRPHVPEWSTIR